MQSIEEDDYGRELSVVWELEPEGSVVHEQESADHNPARISKVMIEDSRRAFVTSANLSTPGTERKMEAGVIIHDTEDASRMRHRLAKLWVRGAITELSRE